MASERAKAKAAQTQTARERIRAELTANPDGLSKSELIRRVEIERGHARSILDSMQAQHEIEVEIEVRDNSPTHVCRLIDDALDGRGRE